MAETIDTFVKESDELLASWSASLQQLDAATRHTFARTQEGLKQVRAAIDTKTAQIAELEKRLTETPAATSTTIAPTEELTQCKSQNIVLLAEKDVSAGKTVLQNFLNFPAKIF
jgi:BMFP domain-containing protein YqiC